MSADRLDWAARLRSPREIALTVGAVLGVLCILAALAGLIFGIKPLVFRSGSMAPAMDTGALAFARQVPAEQVHIDDVVSVDNTAGARVTHRVVDIETLSGGETALTLRGDANRVDDPAPYITDSVDRVVFHIDKAGYAVTWLSSPAMRVVIVAGAIALLVTAFKPSRRGQMPAPDATETERELVSETASTGSDVADSTEYEVGK